MGEENKDEQAPGRLAGVSTQRVEYPEENEPECGSEKEDPIPSEEVEGCRS